MQQRCPTGRTPAPCSMLGAATAAQMPAFVGAPSVSGRWMQVTSRRLRLRVAAGPSGQGAGRPRLTPEQLKVNYDPDRLLGTPKTGHIARRMIEKSMQKDAKAYSVVIKKAEEERRMELEERRNSRSPPEKDYQLVEYLLETPADDMEYEVARCRPLLTPEFFKYLSMAISTEKFGLQPDKEKLAELEMLRTYLEQGVQAVDAAVAKTSSAVERMKKLLSAPDKKVTLGMEQQCILDMAAANEIDLGLVELLRENASAARDARQEQAAVFMEKVAVAAAKYLVTPA